MGAQLGAALTLRYQTAIMFDEFQGAFNWTLMMPRNASLSDGCSPHRCRKRCAGDTQTFYSNAVDFWQITILAGLGKQ